MKSSSTHGADAPKADAWGTVPGQLQHWASAAPNRIALAARSANDQWMRVTYAELNEVSDRIARSFLKAGVKPGDRVALLLDNSCGYEAVATTFAAHKARAIAVPINPRNTSSEIEYAVNYCGAKTLVYMAPLGPTVEACQLPQINMRVVVGGDQETDVIEWPYLAADESDLPLVLPQSDDHANWLFTSGTTALPKCAMFTHSSCVATGRGFSLATDAQEGDVMQSPVPFFASAGISCFLLTGLAVGATMVLEVAGAMEDLIHNMRNEGTTIFSGVPTIFALLLDSDEFNPDVLPNLRLFNYGGSPMLPRDIQRLTERFPNIELRQTYGQTESGPTGIYLKGEYAISKLGAVGKDPMTPTEVDVQDEYGNSVEPGGTGEICYRGPALMEGYYNNAAATEEAFRDGWLRSGDIARIDEGGFIFHMDRLKDIIIRGGFNIASLEVETRLRDHPDVVDAAVVGIPHPKLGEDVAAYVVLRDGADLPVEEIQAHCRETLADYKVPRLITVVDALPRNAMGKLLKRELRV